MEIICSDRENDLYTNKFGNMIGVDIVKNVEIAEMTPKSIYNTFS